MMHPRHSSRLFHCGRLAIGAIAVLTLSGCFNTSSTDTGIFAATANQPAEAVSIGIDTQALIVAAVPAELSAYLEGTGERAGIAVLDQTTGTSVEVDQHLTFQTASIMKVDILAARLYQHQRAGTSLSSSEKSFAYAMITESDNNAASALWKLDGQVNGVNAVNHAFGLTETLPHGGGLWGETVTTPADQLRLLRAVMDPHGPLSDDNREYLLTLMGHVDKAQDWGITAAALANASGVFVKNGWDTIDAQGGLWGINSVGRIVEPGHDWLVATLSSNHRTMPGGIKVVEELSRLAVEGLRMETSAEQ